MQQRKMFETYRKTYQKKVVVCDSIKSIFFDREENKKTAILERLLIPGLTLVEIPFNTSSYDSSFEVNTLYFMFIYLF